MQKHCLSELSQLEDRLMEDFGNLKAPIKFHRFGRCLGRWFSGFLVDLSLKVVRKNCKEGIYLGKINGGGAA